MAREETCVLTNMCMVYDGTKVLVQERIDDDYGGITFPGGHVEKGESFTDAVIREVYEETGLKIASPALCGIKDWPNDDGSRYNAYVNYWMPFNGGVGFHDATWRSLGEFNKTTYVNNGSHGCVNMKKEDAQVLYTNTKVNTAVKVRE